MSGRWGIIAALTGCAWLMGCEAEKRPLGPSRPASPPVSAADPREPQFQGNAYQIASGGRLFTWYGCGRCHSPDAKGWADLGDDRWAQGGTMDAVYASIAYGRPNGMPGYTNRVPTEQIWQLAAYVRDLHKIPAVKRRRQDLEQSGEPQADRWTGALR